MTGTVYAPAAQLAESGNARLNTAIVVQHHDGKRQRHRQHRDAERRLPVRSLTPRRSQGAYAISTLALDGTGQTIAIVDAYDNPNIFQSIDAFDSQFGLDLVWCHIVPAVRTSIVVLDRAQPRWPGNVPCQPPTPMVPAPTTGKSRKHSTSNGFMPSPLAYQIVLVEASSQSLSDLMAGVATAASQPGVSVVSMSLGLRRGQGSLRRR